MNIYPAIDLKNSQVVRLFQGDYDQMTVYADDPILVVSNFIKQGAKNLHVVDLDGAKDGDQANFTTIKSILDSCNIFVQVGGGIRDEQTIKKYLNIGVSRVILGTVAVKKFDFVAEMVTKYKEKIAVGVDAKAGYVAINGWKEITDISSLEFCKNLYDVGVSTIIYTDIEKDGSLTGTNLKVYEELSKIAGLNVIASGGITFEWEIEKLEEQKIYGAILGKALYTNALSLSNIIEKFEEKI